MVKGMKLTLKKYLEHKEQLIDNIHSYKSKIYEDVDFRLLNLELELEHECSVMKKCRKVQCSLERSNRQLNAEEQEVLAGRREMARDSA